MSQEGFFKSRRDPYCDGYDYWTIVDLLSDLPEANALLANLVSLLADAGL